MPKYEQPESFEALVEEYDYYIEATLQKIGRGHIRMEDLPDLKQAVYLRLWKIDALGQYVPERASFSNYLFQIIRSVAINTFYTNVRRPLNCAIGTVECPRLQKTYQAGGPRLVLETHPRFRDTTLEHRLQVRDTLARLAALAKTVRDGAELTQVLTLLAEDRTAREIATLLGHPPQWVTQQRQRLQRLLRYRLHVLSA